jgi:prevent-host-death family protein
VTEISVKKARGEFSSLLKRVEKGEEVIILRRGKQVARLVPPSGAEGRLPSLKDFRASIRVRGEPLSRTVLAMREHERY